METFIRVCTRTAILMDSDNILGKMVPIIKGTLSKDSEKDQGHGKMRKEINTWVTSERIKKMVKVILLGQTEIFIKDSLKTI